MRQQNHVPQDSTSRGYLEPCITPVSNVLGSDICDLGFGRETCLLQECNEADTLLGFTLLGRGNLLCVVCKCIGHRLDSTKLTSPSSPQLHRADGGPLCGFSLGRKGLGISLPFDLYLDTPGAVGSFDCCGHEKHLGG
ncbi:MAG: hypothetical protein ACD_85C00002G0001 [uncultured bacterium]|nr:MAG: hypothetical protein ACD_85C00002G0001 [uncultured bacterium]